MPRNGLGRSRSKPLEVGLKVCCVCSHLLRSREGSAKRLDGQVSTTPHSVPDVAGQVVLPSRPCQGADDKGQADGSGPCGPPVPAGVTQAPT